MPGFCESTFLGQGARPAALLWDLLLSQTHSPAAHPQWALRVPLSFSAPLPQIILAILVSWLLCFIFTVTDVFPPDSSKYGFYARTDARRGVLLVAPWFKVPYPCKCACSPGASTASPLVPEALLALSHWWWMVHPVSVPGQAGRARSSLGQCRGSLLMAGVGLSQSKPLHSSNTHHSLFSCYLKVSAKEG